MSVWDKLGAAVGIGNAKIVLTVQDARCFRGRSVHGSLALDGGTVDQDVAALTVDLVEHWVTYTSNRRTYHERHRDRVVLAENVLVSPGSHEEHTFEIAVPSDARCGSRQEAWTLQAEAHISRAVDARVSIPLNVQPHVEVLAVEQAIRESFGFVQVSWDAPQRPVHYDFRAPEWLKGKLDGATFRLDVIGDDLQGRMSVNEQEHGIGDLLKAAIGADRHSVDFQIPLSALANAQGAPDPSGAVPYLTDLFGSIGVQVPIAPTG